MSGIRGLLRNVRFETSAHAPRREPAVAHRTATPAKPRFSRWPGRVIGVVAVSCCAFVLSVALLMHPASAQGVGKGPMAQGRGLTATLVQGLDFGSVGNSPTVPGTATVDPVSGTKTVAGGATDLGGVHAAAVFNIRGAKQRAFAITLPSQITITGPGGSTTTINNFTSDPAAVGVLDGNGKATVTVGATLQVSGGLATGAYTNLFDITVTYQ